MGGAGSTKPEALRHDTASPARRESAAGDRSVLLIDDDVTVCRVLEPVLRGAGFEVMTTSDPVMALDIVMHRSFDVIVSDVAMPGISGVELLHVLRTYDLDVPVILMADNPSLDTAMEALHLGALQYLQKPTPSDVLINAVERASRLHQIAAMKRLALERAEVEAGEKATLAERFERALESMWMAFQPIVSPGASVFGYEALMRTRESSLPDPGAVLDAAQKLGRGLELGRRVRELSARAFADAPTDAALFVNLHASDLLDPDLYESNSALGSIAQRVVLEITERATLDGLERRPGARLGAAAT